LAEREMDWEMYEATEDRIKKEIQIACSCLFPTEYNNHDDFFDTLTFEKLKDAYRKGAKAHHPDRSFAGHERARSDRFMEIQNAYELLTCYLLEKSDNPLQKKGVQKTIISVGGAKGGIGKSIFVANLGVYLSSKGFRTVLVDLDLGGANLHLYMGNRSLLTKSVNDFLKRRAATIQEIMIESCYGPLLIGGDSSELGASNIEFAKKLRLIKAIRNIEADYIIIDLGGDTSFNTIDFFLLADYAIVLTTPESASYIGSYHFIKAALYRKLHRLFGPESKFRDEPEKILEKLIRNLTLSPDGPQVKSISELIDVVRAHQPMNLSTLMKAISDFHPYLVVNKATNEIEATQVATRILDVSKRWLSKEVTYLGCISEQREVKRCVTYLIPVVAKYPQGTLAGEIDKIAEQLLFRGHHG
jgi:flagellar biosynthesis protein FlhG